MSSRTIWNAGVEVHQRHLDNEQNERIDDNNRLIANTSTSGVVSGLAVTLNNNTFGPPPTKVDIAIGTGYAPNGEWLDLTVALSAVPLPTTVVNGVYYVILMQDEVASNPEAHESDGLTRNTKMVNSPRVVTMVKADYLNLPTSDTTLSNNALDRALVVAICTVNSTNTGMLIENPTAYQSTLSVTQPTNTSGVVIIDIASGTTPSADVLPIPANGILAWNGTAFTWTPPGGAVGVLVIPTISGVVVVYDATTNFTITLNVTFSALPSYATSDQITVTNIYTALAPRFTAKDSQHRGMLGTGIPSATNPHGMTMEDLAPGASGTLVAHQDNMHTGGLLRASSINLLKAAITNAGTDFVAFTGFGGPDLAFINGRQITSAAPLTVTFTSGIPADPCTYDIWLGQDGNIFKQLRTQFLTSTALNTIVQILDTNFAPNTYTLAWDGTNYSFDSGPGVVKPLNDHFIRLYGKDHVSYVDLFVSASPPGPAVSVLVTVSAQPDVTLAIPLCSVPSIFTAGTLGYGFGATRLAYDKRVWGTLDELNTRKDAGMINAAKAVGELLGDGIIVQDVQIDGDNGATTGNGRVSVPSASVNAFNLGPPSGGIGAITSGSCQVLGGFVYIDGRRTAVPTKQFLSLSVSTVHLFYIGFSTTSNAYEVMTAPCLILPTANTWQIIEAGLPIGTKYLRISELTLDISGNSPDSATRLDLRTFIGQKRDRPLGVVGLNVNNQAHVNAFSGDAIRGIGGDSTGLSVSTGHGGYFQGGNNAGYGVVSGIGVEGVGTDSAVGSLLDNIAGWGVVGRGGRAASLLAYSVSGYGTLGYGGDANGVNVKGGAGLFGRGGAGFDGSSNYNQGVIPGISSGGDGGKLFGGKGPASTFSEGGVGGSALSGVGGDGGAGFTNGGDAGYGCYLVGGAGGASTALGSAPFRHGGVGGYGMVGVGGAGGAASNYSLIITGRGGVG